MQIVFQPQILPQTQSVVFATFHSEQSQWSNAGQPPALDGVLAASAEGSARSIDASVHSCAKETTRRTRSVRQAAKDKERTARET